MNWGKSIVVALVAFMSFITILVILFFTNRVDLVSEDYYKQEIDFETEIASKRNFQESGAKFSMEQNEEFLIANLPVLGREEGFSLNLVRPNDNKDDLSFKIDDTQTFLIDKKKLKKGVYDYRLSFIDGEKKYLETGNIYVK